MKLMKQSNVQTHQFVNTKLIDTNESTHDKSNIRSLKAIMSTSKYT